MPPVTVRSIAPSFVLLPQEIWVTTAENEIGAGSVIVTVAMDEAHPLETVQEYVPAASPVAVAELPPLGAQLYVNGPAPVAVIVALPLLLPLHDTLVKEETVAVMTGVAFDPELIPPGAIQLDVVPLRVKF